MKIRNYPGYTGAFTREQAVGAIPNGVRVVKREGEPGDANPDGTRGTVLGSIDGSLLAPKVAKKYNARFAYWVEWDASPKLAVFVVDRKIGVLQ